MSVGIRLKKIKKAFRYSQIEFAELLDVSTTSVNCYFNGKNKPRMDKITRILERIPDLNMNWLLFGKGEMLLNKEPRIAINTSGKNNSIGQRNYDTEEEVISIGGDSIKFKHQIAFLENEVAQLKNTITHQKMIIEEYQQLMEIKKGITK